MSHLFNFKEFDGECVTFGGGAKGGKITGKGTLKTGKLDFEDVYFVKELHFNLLSISQICDKKKIVLFTDTRCFILSPDFKLTDESQVLLKVPRKNNMCSVDMKNIVPKKSLTCLVTKATLDESMLWHRRLGHVNFKTINKIVKENLVKGLPTKRFENDQTYVACLKGKQHKASCKSKIQNSITQALFILHMDLFGTKDETSGILKSFITKIENLVDKKQNGVAERRNMTLIEAARTMLADSKLPTTFWAEVVNTACYEQIGKVEENLHIRFLENKLIIVGDGPKWLFDIDALTKLMNYVPVVAGRNFNDFLVQKKVLVQVMLAREIQQQESLVTKDTTLEVNLSNDGTTLDASLVTEGTTLDASLVTEGIALDVSLVAKQSTVDSTISSLGDNATDAEKILVDTIASDIEYADIEPSYDSNTVSGIVLLMIFKDNIPSVEVTTASTSNATGVKVTTASTKLLLLKEKLKLLRRLELKICMN
nr:putative ribonuclease H-like domain-containing protein [Tanacetum cinerariifolium]